jgi:ankyrin repeat protein
LPENACAGSFRSVKTTDTRKFWEAIQKGDRKAIEPLLVNLESTKDKAAINDALLKTVIRRVFPGQMEVIDRLLAAGANPNQDTSIGTLLMWVAMNGNLEMVKRLILAGVDFQCEVKRETALSAALSENQTAVVAYLENLGATAPPSTVLLYASMHGDIERMKRALDEGAGIEKTGGTFRETPLMAAAGKGEVAAVKLLLQRGANPNTRVESRTAIFEAVQSGKSVEVVDALVQGGADLSLKYYDETVLMAAAKNGYLPIVKRLVELGVNVHARDKNCGMTALDHAKTNKHKEVVAYLGTLGAKAERDEPRILARALAREYGGKPTEHSHGFMWNAKLAGNKCQFNFVLRDCTVMVTGLKYSAHDFRRMPFPEIMVSSDKPEDRFKEFHKSKSATQSLGLEVYSTIKASEVKPQKALVSFCVRWKKYLKPLQLATRERVDFSGNSMSFVWRGMDVETVRVRLQALSALIQTICRPPQPERQLFASEWLLKPAPKVSASAHWLGGKLDQPVACPRCGGATNLMSQLDLSDRVLPKTALGPNKFPAFWCLTCLDWDAAFFDVSGPIPQPLTPAGRQVNSSKIKAGEADLAERRILLSPVLAGKKAGRKSKLGGSPSWIQMDDTPDCPKCEKPMAFVLQLASDARISYCDMGLLYAFACPECRVTASLIQSH